MSGGAVSRMNRSSAATTAAASSADAAGATMVSFGRRFIWKGFCGRRLTAAALAARAYRARRARASGAGSRRRAAGGFPACGDRARARGLASLSGRRLGDAAQGLPGESAVRRLPGHAGAGRRVRAAQVGDLVPGQSRARTADGDRRHLPVGRRGRRAADAARRPLGDRPADRGGGGGGHDGAGGLRRADGRDRRLRAARHLGRPVPGRGGLRAGRLPRRTRRRGRRARPRARLARRLAGAGDRLRHRVLRDARRGDRRRRGQRCTPACT